MSVKLPVATLALAGINSAVAQTIGGAKTFADALTFQGSGGTLAAGQYNAAGTWTFGPSGGNNPHAINGLTTIMTVSSNLGGYQAKYTGNQSIAMRCNTEGAQIAGNTNLDNTSFIGGDGAGRILFQGAGSTGLQFETSPATTANSARTWTQYGALANNGQWTLGNLASSQDHIIQSGDNVPLILKSALTTCHIQFVYSTSSTGGYIRSASGVPLNFLNQASTSVGQVDSNGAWDQGIAGNDISHQFRGSTTNTATIQARNSVATASSSNRCVDARYVTDTDCTGGYFFACLNSSGTTIGRIEATANTTTTFTGSSDERLKQDPQTFNGLDLVMDMIPRDFEWKSNPGNRSKGFYAQELYTVYPEAVSVGSDELTEDESLLNPWGIDYGKLTPVLVKALQELKQQFDDYVAAHP